MIGRRQPCREDFSDRKTRRSGAPALPFVVNARVEPSSLIRLRSDRVAPSFRERAS